MGEDPFEQVRADKHGVRKVEHLKKIETIGLADPALGAQAFWAWQKSFCPDARKL